MWARAPRSLPEIRRAWLEKHTLYVNENLKTKSLLKIKPLCGIGRSKSCNSSWVGLDLGPLQWPPSTAEKQRGTARGRKLICVCFIYFFPISSLQHIGGSFPRLDNASVFAVLSDMDFLSLPVHWEAVAVTSLITVRRSNYRSDSHKISSGAAGVAIRLHQTRCSFQAVHFPLASGSISSTTSCVVIQATSLLVRT